MTNEERAPDTCEECGARVDSYARCVSPQCPGKQECKHLLTRSWCGICNGREKQRAREEKDAREELLLRPDWFVSRFPGKCGQCGTGFPIGEPIKECKSRPGDLFFFKYKASCCAEES